MAELAKEIIRVNIEDGSVRRSLSDYAMKGDHGRCPPTRDGRSRCAPPNAVRDATVQHGVWNRLYVKACARGRRRHGKNSPARRLPRSTTSQSMAQDFYALHADGQKSARSLFADEAGDALTECRFDRLSPS